MAPCKQPCSLLKLSTLNSIYLFNNYLRYIETSFDLENDFQTCENVTLSLKGRLTTMLPATLFDILSTEKSLLNPSSDPRIIFHLLTHPQMSALRVSNNDRKISPDFWIQNLPHLSKLSVLDLKFVCTDEIVQVVCNSCPLLEEFNMMSRLDLIRKDGLAHRSFVITTRNVSDASLIHVSKLRNLRILTLDLPRNKMDSTVGHYLTSSAIVSLVNKLPFLEELRIESCDIGFMLANTNYDSTQRYKLRKVICHFTSPKDFRRLAVVCPDLRELSLSYLFTFGWNNAILDEISISSLRLERIDLSFFPYSRSMESLFVAKGHNLTYLKLQDAHYSFSLDMIVTIGKSCPNLTTLYLKTDSALMSASYIQKPAEMFQKLKHLSLGNANFSIEYMLNFFLSRIWRLQKLELKYATNVNMDAILLSLVDRNYFRHLKDLWLDCTLEVSKDVLMKVIQRCDHLLRLTVNCFQLSKDLKEYIQIHNLDLTLGTY